MKGENGFGRCFLGRIKGSGELVFEIFKYVLWLLLWDKVLYNNIDYFIWN